MRVAEYIERELARSPLHFTLIDPDKQEPAEAGRMAAAAWQAGSSAIMVGGSTGLSIEKTHASVEAIKRAVELPVILFPPGAHGIAPNADAIFFMSMLNSRVRRFIVEEQIAGAAFVKRMGLEPISMGYIVVEPGGEVGRVGRADLIGREELDKAVDHALAAQFFGMRFVYLEAGSGADRPVPHAMIRAVRDQIDVPLIVGGGIRDAETARGMIESGADIIVTGTLIERVVDVKSALQDIVERLRTAVRRNVERFERVVIGEPPREGVEGPVQDGLRPPLRPEPPQDLSHGEAAAGADKQAPTPAAGRKRATRRTATAAGPRRSAAREETQRRRRKASSPKEGDR